MGGEKLAFPKPKFGGDTPTVSEPDHGVCRGKGWQVVKEWGMDDVKLTPSTGAALINGSVYALRKSSAGKNCMARAMFLQRAAMLLKSAY